MQPASERASKHIWFSPVEKKKKEKKTNLWMKIKPAKWDYRGRRWTSEAETRRRRRRRKKGALLRRSVDLVSYLTKSRYTIENTFIGTIKRCWQNATLKCDSQKENADWKLAVAPIKQRKQESSSNDNNSRKKEARVTNARLGGYDRLFFFAFSSAVEPIGNNRSFFLSFLAFPSRLSFIALIKRRFMAFQSRIHRPK